MSRLDEEFARYGVTLKDLLAKGGLHLFHPIPAYR